jgi:uncharacterized protein (DUF4415 family)
MKKEYDFSRAKPNPFAGRLKKQVTIKLGVEVISYFKAMAKRVGVPYQSLINLYLRDCVASKRRCDIHWKRPLRKAG